MIINKKYYKFYRDLTGYHIQGGQIGTTIWYELISVGNNSETVILTATIADNTLETLSFPVEDNYRVDIYFPDDLNPGLEITDSYEIGFFPFLKGEIIKQMKFKICDCENIDSQLCVTTTEVPVQKNLYNTELTANSIFTYSDLLLPPQFLREADCCVKNFIGSYSEQILAELQSAYSAISVRGTPATTVETLRRYTALYYIIFYVIEMDISRYQSSYSGALPEDEDELAAIEATFETTAIKACFTELGLDFDQMYKIFKNCYEINDYSACRIEVIDVNAIVKNLIMAIDYGLGGGVELLGTDIFLDVNQSFDLSYFYWEVTGTPINLKVDEPYYKTIDNQPADGVAEPIVPDISYPPAIPAIIKWQLKGSNVDTIEREIRWGYPVFYGCFTPAIADASPTEADILDVSNFRLALNTYDGNTLVFPEELNTGVGARWFFALPAINALTYKSAKYALDTSWISISGGTFMIRLTDEVTVNLGGGAGNVDYQCYELDITDLPDDVQMAKILEAGGGGGGGTP